MSANMGAATAEELRTNCPICMEPNCDVKLANCGHLLHWDPCCLGLLDNGHSNCPICRTPITNWYNLRGGIWWDDSN